MVVIYINYHKYASLITETLTKPLNIATN